METLATLLDALTQAFKTIAAIPESLVACFVAVAAALVKPLMPLTATLVQAFMPVGSALVQTLVALSQPFTLLGRKALDTFANTLVQLVVTLARAIMQGVVTLLAPFVARVVVLSRAIMQGVVALLAPFMARIVALAQALADLIPMLGHPRTGLGSLFFVQPAVSVCVELFQQEPAQPEKVAEAMALVPLPASRPARSVRLVQVIADAVVAVSGPIPMGPAAAFSLNGSRKCHGQGGEDAQVQASRTIHGVLPGLFRSSHPLRAEAFLRKSKARADQNLAGGYANNLFSYSML